MMNCSKNMKKKIHKKNLFQKVADFFALLLTGKSKDAVDLGICDYSGQGRNKYGE